MIQLGTRLKVCDNSGAKIVECIHIYGGHKRRTASIGDIIAVAVKKAIPNANAKQGQVLKAIVVRTRNTYKRLYDDGYIRFNENACVIIQKASPKKGDQYQPSSTRIFGPIPNELKFLGGQKITSLAKEVI